jgi:hypothetical protein
MFGFLPDAAAWPCLAAGAWVCACALASAMRPVAAKSAALNSFLAFIAFS